MIGGLAGRLTGSGDLFHHRGRRPWASVNFIAAHDGFTLRDLVSYDGKHNDANGEDNRDGTNDNRSWNCGVEGPSEDPSIRALRLRQSKNLLATLLLSQGIPMLVAGDEFGRTQHGNNNAYGQDNETSWVDWNGIDADGEALLLFARRVIQVRREHAAFHRDRFFVGNPDHKDITWLRADGQEMTHADWDNGFARTLAFLLSGEAGHYHLTPRGEPIPDADFFVVLNAHDEAVEHRLPALSGPHRRFEVLIATADDVAMATPIWRPGQHYAASARSVTAFISREPAD